MIILQVYRNIEVINKDHLYKKLIISEFSKTIQNKQQQNDFENNRNKNFGQGSTILKLVYVCINFEN